MGTYHILCQGGFYTANDAQSRGTSVSLDNEDGFVVNTTFLVRLSQPVVSLYRVFEQSIANLFCRNVVVVAHDAFHLPPIFHITADINPVGEEEENLSRAQQR